MKILIIGSGGREHALAWKIRQSPRVSKIFSAPGNAGMCAIADCIPLRVDDFAGLANFAKTQKIGLTIVGPEVPLAAGIADYFAARGLPLFGPTKSAARLESSKAFSKEFLKKHNVATAAYRRFSEASLAAAFIDSLPGGSRLVVKADGLAAGKGVIICQDAAAAKAAVADMLERKTFGEAGSEVVVEEFLEGEEASIQIFLDGINYAVMAAAQDHKRVNDGDRGPNTGGMGAYAPAPVINGQLVDRIRKSVIEPVVKGLAAEGIDYRGVLYIGLMMVKGEPYVLEFNCRFGDPETQAVLPLLKTDLIDVMEKVREGALDKLEIEWYNKTAVCVVLASGGYPGDYKKGIAVSGLEDAAAVKDAVVFHAGTAADKAAPGRIVTDGGRVLGVTGLGSDIREAVAAAYKAAGKIKFEGMHYRRDIARRALDRL